VPPQWLWDLAVVNVTEKQQKQSVRSRETRKEENEKDQERDQTETTSCQPAIFQKTFI
jgi:hypothetical protein